MRKIRNKNRTRFAVYGAAIIIIAAITVMIALEFNDTSLIVTITDRERIVDRGLDGSRYLVWATTDYGRPIVFENTDSLIRGKFNSSDFQGQLTIGQTFRITLIGIRIPFLSRYQNIIDFEPLDNAGA